MTMKHQVPHDLPLPLAKKAADAALQSYKTKFPDYDPQVSWTDERTANVELKAKGLSITGVFEISDSAISIDMEVPFLLKPFKAKAIDVIEEQIKQWIAKAKAGELG